MSALPSARREWLTSPGLTRLWESVRKRLESNGVQAIGWLRASAAGLGLRQILEEIGPPLTDRRAARADVAARRERVWSSLGLRALGRSQAG
ncbi:hypothetical protein SALBM311S_05943 [Streptomyces alboniger]